MEVLSKRVLVLLERDPETEKWAKALLQGPCPSISPQGNSSVPCFLCGQSVRRGQGSRDGPFRDAVAEVFARSVEEFNERGQGAMEDCWRGESCPSCFTLMEGVWTLQGKIEGLRGEAKTLVERAVGLRGSGRAGGLERPPEEVGEGQRRVKKGNDPPVDKGNSSYSPEDERRVRPSSARVEGDLVGAPSSGERDGGSPAKKNKKKGASARLNLSCYFCQKTFPTPSRLEVHLSTHTGEKPFPCPHCGKEFSSKGHLKRHVKYHRKDKAFTCPHCGKGFVEKSNLKTHMIRSHLKEKPFKCRHEGCLFSFATNYELTEHSRDHSGEKPFKCEQCGKFYSRKGALNHHMKSHIDLQEWPTCNICGKGFYNKYRLDDHIRRHMEEKYFHCSHPGCTSSFVTRGNLEQHSRVHSGERPFACKYPNCGKAFSQPGALKRHSMTHSGEKPFLCPLEGCGKTFTQHSNLDKHLRNCGAKE